MRPASPLVHADDARLFAPGELERLRRAVRELSWLLSRGYSDTAALKLVGDRHALAARQRAALSRCACADDVLERRLAHEVTAVSGGPLSLDGYNVLTTLRVARAGGLVLQGRDGCYRDLAGLRGRHHDLAQAGALVACLGRVTAELGIPQCRWYLERRVSQSAELARLLCESAAVHGWNWSVDLVGDADAAVLQCQDIVASSDSRILDRCQRWFNLTGQAIGTCAPHAWRIELS